MQAATNSVLTSFEGSCIEKDEHGSLWVRDDQGVIQCEAFYQADDESLDDMLDAGYILVPYQFEGNDVFVEVAEDAA